MSILSSAALSGSQGAKAGSAWGGYGQVIGAGVGAVMGYMNARNESKRMKEVAAAKMAAATAYNKGLLAEFGRNTAEIQKQRNHVWQQTTDGLFYLQRNVHQADAEAKVAIAAAGTIGSASIYARSEIVAAESLEKGMLLYNNAVQQDNLNVHVETLRRHASAAFADVSGEVSSMFQERADRAKAEFAQAALNSLEMGLSAYARSHGKKTPEASAKKSQLYDPNAAFGLTNKNPSGWTSNYLSTKRNLF